MRVVTRVEPPMNRTRFWLSLTLIAAVATLALAFSGARPVAPSAYHAFGRGPSLVLVHGLGSRSTHWLPMARRLAAHWRVTLVDLPGHGESEMPDPFSLDRAEAALDRALARIDGGPVVLVGHSLGGLVATAEAIDHPERVKCLVLVETALRPQVDAAGRTALLGALDGDYDHVLRTAYGAFGRDSLQGLALYQEVRELDPANVKPWIRLALSADLSRDAARLRMPVLAVLAERSWAKDEAWPAVAESLGYARVPRLTPTRLEGCGHFIMLDRPDALASLIERFARSGTDWVAAR
jgi:pimeloyl-[acyl-carrier protein] methyl ester esterase